MTNLSITEIRLATPPPAVELLSGSQAGPEGPHIQSALQLVAARSRVLGREPCSQAHQPGRQAAPAGALGAAYSEEVALAPDTKQTQHQRRGSPVAVRLARLALQLNQCRRIWGWPPSRTSSSQQCSQNAKRTLLGSQFALLDNIGSLANETPHHSPATRPPQIRAAVGLRSPASLLT